MSNGQRIVVVLLAAVAATVVLGAGAHQRAPRDEFCTSVTKTRFIAHYEDSPAGGELASLDVLVYGKKPTSATAEIILRHNLKAALALYRGKDVLATAWHVKGDDERKIPLRDGSTNLVYIAKENKIKTFKEYDGTKTRVSVNRSSAYFVEYEEHDILVPPKGRKFASVDVVFQKEPAREQIYRILVAELRKAVAKQKTKWRTTAAPYLGNRDDPAGRVQIRDNKRRDGGYIIVEYDPATGRVTGGDGKDLGRINP